MLGRSVSLAARVAGTAKGHTAPPTSSGEWKLAFYVFAFSLSTLALRQTIRTMMAGKYNTERN